MQVFKTNKELSSYLESVNKSESIGFVPTMGALHQGHLSLIKRAFETDTLCVVSIFVNPTQFDKKEDLVNYPRTLERDVELLKTLNTSKIIVFAPSVQEIYDEDISSNAFSFDGLEYEMEGKFRDGHFDGVGTVVKRLFQIVLPDHAYFGEKDFQQLQIIRKMVSKHKLAVKIIGVEIHRETSGLAMSSRNERLTDEYKKEAPFIYKTLSEVKSKFGTKSANKLTEWAENQFKTYSSLKLEYFVIADTETLKPVKRKSKKKKYRAFIAAYAGNIRLIDNIALN